MKDKRIPRKIGIGICVAFLAVLTVLAMLAYGYQEAGRQPERVLAKRIKEAAETLHSDVTMSTYDVDEQQFFPFLYGKLQQLCEVCPGEQIVCYVDGETDLEGLARVEIGNPDEGDKHYLYLAQGNVVYEICGKMNQKKWNRCLNQIFLREDLFWGDTRVEGILLKNRGFDFVYDEQIDTITTMAVYSFGSYEADVASYERSGERFVFVSKKFFGGEEQREETCVRKVEKLPDCEEERELFAYFLEQYPDMEKYSVYASVSPKTKEHYCRMFQENGLIHCLFYWEGQDYEVVSGDKSGKDAIMPYTIRNSLEAYDTREYWNWVKREDGSSLWSNQEDGSYCLQQDVGEAKDILVQIKPAEMISEEKRNFVIEVYWEGDGEPFWSIQTGKVKQDKMSTAFSDFNADGYCDINYISEGNSRKYIHYLWSPSQQMFVRGPEELEKYLHCYVEDGDSRRLRVIEEGNSRDGGASVYDYQWSNEMDCERIKTFHAARAESGNGVFVHIARCHDGEEQVLMDYNYDIEQYPYYVNQYNLIYDNLFLDFYQDNFLWEKAVWEEDSGESYTLYYAQKILKDGVNDVSGEGHLWVLDKNTKLVKRLFWQEQASCEKVSWEDGQILVIQYFDGSEKRWDLPEILKDPVREIHDRSMQIDYTIQWHPIDEIKYDSEMDKQYKSAYYKAVSSQIPVRGINSGEIYLKGYFGDYFMDETDEEYLEELVQQTQFYYMDFDGDGMPELVMDVKQGWGMHILKYSPEEDAVEFFFASYRMPYFNLMGAGQLYYHHPCLANKDLWEYDIVDKDGQVSLVAYFQEDYDYVHSEDGDGWIGTYWVCLDDELGLVQVDEKSYYEITKNFFDAVENAPSQMSFEEIFSTAIDN